jgi:hypothetical protein
MSGVVKSGRARSGLSLRAKAQTDDESEKYMGQQRAKADADDALVNICHLVNGHTVPHAIEPRPRILGLALNAGPPSSDLF